jgi:hypothetical protein
MIHRYYDKQNPQNTHLLHRKVVNANVLPSTPVVFRVVLSDGIWLKQKEMQDSPSTICVTF